MAEKLKIYNREIIKLLFKYIRPYKWYLILASALVLVITPVSIVIPYLFKGVIDNIIIKTGYLMDTTKVSGYKTILEKNLEKKKFEIFFKSRKRLNDRYVFLTVSSLRFLSKNERENLFKNGVLSRNKYILVEHPRLESSLLNDKIGKLVSQGECLVFNHSYLIRTDMIGVFTVREILLLRAGDLNKLFLYAGIIILLLTVQFFSSYLQIVTLMKLSQLAMKDLRTDLFSHISSLEVSFFDRTPVGKLVSRVSNDIDTLNEFFSSVFVTLLQDILIMLGIAVIMFTVDFKLSLLVMSVTPLVFLFLAIFRIKARKAYGLIRTRISDLNSFLNESVSGMRIIKIFSAERDFDRKFFDRNRNLYLSQMKQLYIIAVFRPLISFLRWLAIAILIYFGATGIVKGSVSYGMIVMFIAYIERFFSPVREMSEKFDIMQSAAAAAEKILEVLKTDNIERGNFALEISPVHERGRKIEGIVEFKNVTFYYRREELILGGISFTVNRGEKVAIVGRTGAGKTTIINLLQGFYRPISGRVMIDGKDISEYSLSTLRKNVIAVSQEPFLFSRSIRDNIIMGDEFNEERFWKAVELAKLKDFILSLPEKENTPVLERGMNLSFGERQLISLARALYADPSILILDEATSSIDSHTEMLVQSAVQNVIKNRTSIVIAHRLSTIRYVDRVIVLNDGRIVEEGSHDELMRKKGYYYRLYFLQMTGV